MQRNRATQKHLEKGSGERIVDGRLQVWLEEDKGGSTRQNWMETSSLWPIHHWQQKGNKSSRITCTDRMINNGRNIKQHIQHSQFRCKLLYFDRITWTDTGETRLEKMCNKHSSTGANRNHLPEEICRIELWRNTSPTRNLYLKQHKNSGTRFTDD